MSGLMNDKSLLDMYAHRIKDLIRCAESDGIRFEAISEASSQGLSLHKENVSTRVLFEPQEKSE